VLSAVGFEIFPSILVGCIYLLVVYALAVGPARRRFGWASDAPGGWRIAAWVLAVLIIFFSLNGPLHEWADGFLFTAHMVQHLLLMLIMPPLLIFGLPPWLIRKALEVRAVYRAARVLTHPGVAFSSSGTSPTCTIGP
jgi:putative membrane protein